MRTHTSLGRRLVAALGAAAIGLIGLAGAANAAGDMPTSYGSIHITKLIQPETKGTAATGAQQNVSGTAVKGVEYTLYKANLNLTSGDATSTHNWETVSEISELVESGYVPSVSTDADGVVTVTIGTSSSDPTTITLTGVTKWGETKTTGPDGKVDFASLSPDLYLVVETIPATGTTPVVSSTAAPFFVTIPMAVATTVNSSGWLSDVYVYPKNPTSTKSVDDSAALGAGDIFSWTVKAQIPVAADNEGIDSFTISDTLDNRLVYEGYNVKLSNDVALSSGIDGDYTVTKPSGASGGTFELKFTEDGLEKLANNGGQSVVLTLNTSVTADVGKGTITNTALVNDHETNEATTYWGNLKLFKYSAGTTTGLKGAKFKVYADAEATKEVSFGKDADGNLTYKTFTSGSDGSVVIDALKTQATGATTYYVKEVQAPDGFVANATPIEVKVYTGQTNVTELSSSAGTNYLPISNTQQSVPSLPLTGANGELLMTAGGIALVLLAGGGALIVRSKRRQS